MATIMLPPGSIVPGVNRVARAYHYQESGERRIMLVRENGSAVSTPDRDGTLLKSFIEQEGDDAVGPPVLAYKSGRAARLAKIQAGDHWLHTTTETDGYLEEVQRVLYQAWEWTVDHRGTELFRVIDRLTNLERQLKENPL